MTEGGNQRKGTLGFLLGFRLQTRHRPEGLTLRGDGARAGKLRQLFLETVLKQP